jgi:hypothetical protein
MRTGKIIGSLLWGAFLVAGCVGGDGVPSTVDEGSRERVAALPDETVAIFWLQIPESAEATVLEHAGVTRLGRAGSTLLVEAPASVFRAAARTDGVRRAGFLTTTEGSRRMDGRLRMQVFGALDQATGEPIAAIVQWASEPTDADRSAMEAAGVTVHSVIGQIVTVEGSAAALGQLAELESVTRMEAETMLQPLGQ